MNTWQRLRQFVHAVQYQKATAGHERLPEHRRGQPARTGVVQPAGEAVLQLGAGPVALAGQALLAAGPFPQPAQEGKPAAQGVRQCFPESFRGGDGMGRERPARRKQGQPAAEGGLAGTGGAGDVEGFFSQAVQKQRVAPFSERFRLAGSGLPRGHGRYIGLAEADILALLQVQAQKVDAFATAPQPVQIGLADLRLGLLAVAQVLLLFLAQGFEHGGGEAVGRGEETPAVGGFDGLAEPADLRAGRQGIGIDATRRPGVFGIEQEGKAGFLEPNRFFVFQMGDGEPSRVVVLGLKPIAPRQDEHVVIAFGHVRQAFVPRPLVEGRVVLHAFHVEAGPLQGRFQRRAVFSEVFGCGGNVDLLPGHGPSPWASSTM
ncbi:MAG: hypothetical protein M3495_14660 [Pseudomonadota bacterium]|nr:hypothetical protein [Pseudomonadota bacterium]